MQFYYLVDTFKFGCLKLIYIKKMEPTEYKVSQLFLTVLIGP